MKKFLISSACMLCACIAFAEGYQVNTFSAKQEGMGHAGVAMSLGSESVIFNPGAVAFMGKTMQVSGALSAISSNVKATIGGNKYETDNKISTPMNISAAFKIYNNLYGGISFYTPYGSSINWGKNWPGAVLNQSVDLKVFTVQPTISWRITDNLSVGAGLMMAWGNVNLNKGLVSPASLDYLITAMNTLQGSSIPLCEGVTPASANLTGNSAMAFGINIGAMWKINDQWNVGASFRSKMEMKVKSGDVKVDYGNGVDPAARGILEASLDNIDEANFSASMPCPYVLVGGVSYKPTEKLTLAFDLQYNGWSTYKYLDIKFDIPTTQFDQHLKKDYKNTFTYHLGAQYALTERFDIRAGMMIDTNPCNTNYYNPETPGTTKFEPSVGFSFRPVKGLSIDVAFMYVGAKKINGATGRYDDFIAAKMATTEVAPGVTMNQALQANGLPVLPLEGTLKGDYKVSAVIPAIGVSYTF